MAHLAPLSKAAKREVLKIKEELQSFWDSVPFRRNWRKPLFSRLEAEPVLAEASEIIVRVRAFLDAKSPSQPAVAASLRVRIGSAFEYLFDVMTEATAPDLSDANVRRRLADGLVRAALSDAHGLMEGLQADELQRLVSEVRAALEAQRSELNDPNKAVARIGELWKQAVAEYERFAALSEAERAIVPDLGQSLRDISGSVEATVAALQRYHNRHADEEERLRIAEEEADRLVQKVQQEEEEQKAAAAAAAAAAASAAASAAGPSSSSSSSSSSSTPSSTSTTPSPADAEAAEAKARAEREQREAELAEQERKRMADEVAASEKSNLIQIQRVSSDVSKRDAELRALAETIDHLDVASLKADENADRKLEQLSKSVLCASEMLLRDLMTLDQLVGSEAIRPVRKQHVIEIQKLLDATERLQHRIYELQHAMENEKKDVVRNALKKSDSVGAKVAAAAAAAAADAEVAAAAAPAAAASSQPSAATSSPAPSDAARSESASPSAASAESSSSDATSSAGSLTPAKSTTPAASTAAPTWADLPLRLRFRSSETPQAYVLQDYLPGMDSNSIKIRLSEDGRELTISGVRTPSPSELAAMRAQLAAYKQTYGAARLPPGETDEQLLLRVGAGRFGSFSESFQVPEDVDVQNISGGYERGVLRVVLPKFLRPRRVPRGIPQADPFASLFGSGGYSPFGRPY